MLRKTRIALEQKIIVELLLQWYNSNKRNLPWRQTNNPYHIWLSEVILQQTRVDQGLPYYLKFIENYPSVKHLSKASLDEVLRLWQGLGYYSRARNLYKCAKTVNHQYNGIFPENYADLIKLPGIGSYTAAAIASFSFNKKVAVVDGNVIRVLSRLYGIENDVRQNHVIKKITQLANDLISAEHPGIFNQAIMEFGALHCLPQKPKCDTCVFKAICKAFISNQQHTIPYKEKKSAKKTRFFQYLVIQWCGKMLLQRRSQNDIWKGLYEFFLIETEHPVEFDQLALPDELIQNPGKWQLTEESNWRKHILSHQVIMSKFLKIDMADRYDFSEVKWPGLQAYTITEVERLPKSILIDKYLGDKIY